MYFHQINQFTFSSRMLCVKWVLHFTDQIFHWLFFLRLLFWHSSSHFSLSVRASAREWMSHKIILQYSSMRRATHPKSLTGLQKCCSEWNKHAAKSEGGRPVLIYSLPFSDASSLHTFIERNDSSTPFSTTYRILYGIVL